MKMLRTGAANETIPPEIERELQHELDLQLAQEAEPITTDEQEYAVIVRLLEDARTGGATPVNGEIQRFRPDQPVDYENEGVLDGTTGKRSMPPQLIVALMAAALVGIFVTLALNTIFATPKPARATAATPSVIASASTVAAPTVTQPPLDAVRVGNVVLPAVYPNALSIGERQWTVNVAPVEKGAWKVSAAVNAANWLAGSVVNWSFGLWDDDDRTNAGLFANLKAGDEATLYLSSGAVRSFKLGVTQLVARPAITIFSQQSPGLTITLIGGDPSGERAVIRGVEEEGMAASTPTQRGAATQP